MSVVFAVLRAGRARAQRVVRARGAVGGAGAAGGGARLLGVHVEAEHLHRLLVHQPAALVREQARGGGGQRDVVVVLQLLELQNRLVRAVLAAWPRARRRSRVRPRAAPGRARAHGLAIAGGTGGAPSMHMPNAFQNRMTGSLERFFSTSWQMVCGGAAVRTRRSTAALVYHHHCSANNVWLGAAGNMCTVCAPAGGGSSPRGHNNSPAAAPPPPATSWPRRPTRAGPPGARKLS